jgi:hypothetical protein
VKLAGLRISTAAGASIAVAPDRVSYILPDSEHIWTTEAPVPSGTLHVEGLDERSGKPVIADIPIAR